MNQMFKILRSIHPVSENLRDYLDDNLKEKKVKKREILLKEGQLCGNLYFVHQGILRGYYSKGGKEISCLFFKEGEVCVDLEGFFTQAHSGITIQAIEECVLYYISYAQLQRIYKEYVEFNIVSRILLERWNVTQFQRFKAMWMQSTYDRVEWFNTTHPELNQRVPAKYIASYLGITDVTLSAAKAKM